MSCARLALPLGFAVLLCPALVHAQEGQERARLRFGGGGEVGWLGAAAHPVVGLGALGVYLRAGVQLNDLVGVHLTAAGSSLLLVNYARAALVADLSPARFISLGTGITTARTVIIPVGGNATDSRTGTFVGAPLVLGFYPGGGRLPNGARNGLGLTLTGIVGWAHTWSQSSQGFGGGLTLSVGYEIR